MYRQARRERLHFYETAPGVRTAAAKGRLVRLAAGPNVVLHDVGFPFVKPAARTFVERLGAQYGAACGERLVVTSATRPATRQPANSVAHSVHPTGMAIDLRKPAGTCLRWLRATLLDLEGAGLIEATEEFGPPHFHVAVFPTPYRQYAAAQARSASRASARLGMATTTAPDSARATTAGEVYRVRAGDTLWDIARTHDTSVNQLLTANELAGSAIRPGQVLVIPSDASAGAAAGDGGGS